MNNDLVKQKINDNKIAIFFSLHHMFKRYRKNLKRINANINFVYQNKIFECLKKSNLVVTDFSSVIFDVIYQRKPFIMYVPDAEDDNISFLYDDDYYNLINSLKNDSIAFENKFFKINEVVNKIIYYINNNYRLDSKLEIFYKTFGFECKNNTQKFINYLDNLK